MPRKSIAAEAESIISGARRSSYGSIEESGAAMAGIINTILRKKLKQPVTPHEVMLIMVGLKLVRESNKSKRDNRVDIIGYTLLADKLATLK